MYATLYATAAAMLASSVLAGPVGSAVYYNGCDYDVYLQSVPASGGGAETSDHTLKSGDTYVQQWNQLTNGQGWSLKLSKTAGSFGSNIIQYEYTFHNDGTIWYDLSHVDGNPWSSDSMIAAIGGADPETKLGWCVPRQAAYEFWNDDGNGMQSCRQDSQIAIAVCSSTKGNDFNSSVHGLLNGLGAPSGGATGQILNKLISGSGLGGVVSAVASNLPGEKAPSTSAAPPPPATTSKAAAPPPSTTSAAPPPPATSTKAAAPPPSSTSAAAGSPSPTPLGYVSGHFVNAAENAPAPTTLATSASKGTDAAGNVVYETVVFTEYATAFATVNARHEHFGHHQH